MLKSKLIDDIVSRVQEISDDAELTREQVGFWLDTYRDGLVKEYLDGLINKGKALDPYYLERETCLELSEEDLDCESDERLYVTISKDPMSLVDDKGFVQLVTSDNVIVLRNRIESSQWIQDLPDSKPSPRNIVFYRQGRNLIVQGLSSKNKSQEFIAVYIPSYANQDFPETAEFKIHDSLIPTLLEMVEETARRQVYQTAQDVENDGQDNKSDE